MSESRREFLRTLAAQAIVIPFGSIGHYKLATAADKPQLDPNDPTATALSYTHAAPNPSKSCASCQLYKGSGSAAWGRCALFSGNLVNAKGWCASWSA